MAVVSIGVEEKVMVEEWEEARRRRAVGEVGEEVLTVGEVGEEVLTVGVGDILMGLVVPEVLDDGQPLVAEEPPGGL